MYPLLRLSALRLAQMIKNRETTSEEVVGQHITRVREVNPTINAVVHDRFALAVDEARNADERIEYDPPDSLPPLLGVPCTIKESFAFVGMPNTSGLVSRKNIIPTRDATTVARIKAAGAIPLGITNVPELCMWMETDNRIYGRTNNPYNAKHIVGGSSGGEGAIVGSGGSPFGIGSDIGGSIRMPAFFNGVFGHKPSSGLVPNTGQYPGAENEAQRYLSTDPLARRAEDLMPLLKILAGPDGQDPACVSTKLGDPAGVDIGTLTIIQVPDNGKTKVSEDLRNAQRKALDLLQRKGARVIEPEIKELKYSFDIWSSMLNEAADTPFSLLLGSGEPVKAVRAMVPWVLKRSPHTLPALVLAMLEKATNLTPWRVRRFVKMGKELRETLESIIGPKGVMLYPPYSRPAPKHHHPILTPFDWVYTAILNMMEFPVTQVPMGLNKQGLPLGVQVASVHGNDHVTIAVAMALEEAYGGWLPPWRTRS